MGKFKVTYVDSISHEIIVEAETKEDASYKLPAWKPGDGYRRITSIEPVIEEYEITYEQCKKNRYYKSSSKFYTRS